MNLGRMLAFASLAFGLLFYLIGVSGMLWPSTPPLDVGLVATSAIFVLLGGLGLLLRGQPQAGA